MIEDLLGIASIAVLLVIAVAVVVLCAVVLYVMGLSHIVMMCSVIGGLVWYQSK